MKVTPDQTGLKSQLQNKVLKVNNWNLTVSFKALSDLSFLETCARNFSFRKKAFPLAPYMSTQFIMSHTSFPGSLGRLLSPLSDVAILTTTSHLKFVKKVRRLEKIWTEETLRSAQMSEMGICHLCQSPTQKIKDLVPSGTKEG